MARIWQDQRVLSPRLPGADKITNEKAVPGNVLSSQLIPVGGSPVPWCETILLPLISSLSAYYGVETLSAQLGQEDQARRHICCYIFRSEQGVSSHVC